MTGRRGFARWALVLMTLPAATLLIGTGTASAGGSCHSQATTGKGVAVTLSGLCVGPTVLYVQPGSSVTWTNQDQTEHTVTGLGFRWGSANSLLQGESISYRFTSAGVYPYSCIIHPGMVGAVVVGDAGSPKAAAGVPLAALAAPSPATAAQTAPDAATNTSATQTTATTPGAWRTIAAVTLALLAAAVTTLALQRRQRVQGPETALS
jgi:plastocyanin